jgi:hypothetical protein
MRALQQDGGINRRAQGFRRRCRRGAFLLVTTGLLNARNTRSDDSAVVPSPRGAIVVNGRRWGRGSDGDAHTFSHLISFFPLRLILLRSPRLQPGELGGRSLQHYHERLADRGRRLWLDSTMYQIS